MDKESLGAKTKKIEDWTTPENIFEVQDLKNRIHNDDFKDIFEKENAKNWLRINRY